MARLRHNRLPVKAPLQATACAASTNVYTILLAGFANPQTLLAVEQGEVAEPAERDEPFRSG